MSVGLVLKEEKKMPRPGPRPYECVRRAWHSDRHQPMRGSIIRQIFRVVTEAHPSATRKNREWQEKLPRVVLKAEEIMYSKANSEAEYMDPDTLWERLNDAVDTIIRRDENETGQFLQPCIEAALVLGCVPVRASRSQRHSNPRMYLGPRFQETAQAASAVPDKTNHHRPPPQPPIPSGNQVSIPRSAANAQLTGSIALSNSPMAPSTSYIATPSGSHIRPNFHQPMGPMGLESNNLLNYGPVYPLYYGYHFQNTQPQFGFRSPQSPNMNNVIVGTPVGWPAAQPSHFASTRNLLPDESAKVAAEVNQVSPADIHGKVVENDCDLSLRLGPSDPSTSVVEKGLAYVTENGGSSSQQENSKCPEGCARNREFSFFPRHNANDPSKSWNDGLRQEFDVQGSNVTSRKRKAPEHLESENGCIQWLPQLRPNQFGGHIRWRGL